MPSVYPCISARAPVTAASSSRETRRWQKRALAHGSSLDGEDTGFPSLSFGRQGFRPINKNTDE